MIPDLAFVKTYLGSTSWTDAEITAALNAEKVAQSNVCKIPMTTSVPPVPTYPDDLAEALCRRVAHNLAVRSLPLGIQSSISELTSSQIRVGGTDAEVRRLEAPYRRRTVG